MPRSAFRQGSAPEYRSGRQRRSPRPAESDELGKAPRPAARLILWAQAAEARSRADSRLRASWELAYGCVFASRSKSPGLVFAGGCFFAEMAQQRFLIVEKFDAERVARAGQPYGELPLHHSGMRRHHHHAIG